MTAKPFLVLLFILPTIGGCKKESETTCENSTDIQPMSEVFYQSFDPPLSLYIDSLDINDDGINDLFFSLTYLISDPNPPFPYEGTVKAELFIQTLSPTLVFSLGQEIDSTTWEYSCLEVEDEIDDNLTWVSSAATWHDYYLNSGPINGGIWSMNPNEGYVAFKSIDPVNPFIGWLKMHYDDWPGAQIDELSYKTLENHSFYVGQTEL